MPTIKFYTLGCKANQYDTQVLREKFLSRGFRELENSHPADTYLINTCTVTHRADSESLNLIRRAKRENPRAKIIVSGCLTKSAPRRIKAACPNALVTCHLPLVTRDRVTSFKGHTRAFLKVQDGCANFCSYCIVPLVRGRPRSKPLARAIREAEALVANGFQEIVLTGICLGAYGRDLKPQIDLVEVIEALEKIKGLLRIRLSSIEAGDVSDALIEKISDSDKLCRHLHIPIQSGDDTVLRAMWRKYRRRDYLNLIRKIKKQIPGIAITTDVLVGFPVEAEKNFAQTLDLVRKIQPLKTHIFPYSPREGTAAAGDFPQALNPLVIKKRQERLKRIADACALNYQKRFLGKIMPVLFEECLKENASFWQGHTDNYLKVQVKSSRCLRNRLINVNLDKIDKSFLSAHLC
jgi:threonylcarbamoyladenosine tRNA methylthiotransferase MtaB